MLVSHSDFGKYHKFPMPEKMFNFYHKSNKSPCRSSLNIAYTRIAPLEEENYKLRERCISLEEIQQSSDSCQFWTGFPNYGTFKALFDFLNEAAHLKTNWRGQATVESRHFSEAYKSKPGPTSKNSNEQEFLMVMIRLRAGLPLRDLAQRFGLSVSSVSKICTAWINLMYFELKKLCQMPDWDQTVTRKTVFPVSSFANCT